MRIRLQLLVCFFCFLPHLSIAQVGIINTIAGNGQNISNGDNGAAINASVAAPSFGVFDKEGNYYFVEVTTHKVRRISISGIITTVCGTGVAGYNGDSILASSAQLNNPSQLAIDHKGNLLIADYTNNRVRRIDRLTGIISTLAGTGSSGYSGDGDSAKNCTLNAPFGICTDPWGNIFVADYGNSIIRRIDTFGIITLFAGTPGVAGYSGDNGLATSAQLIGLRGMCADNNGNIYIVAGNIRRIEVSTGVISTVAGNSIAGYNGDNISATSASLNSPIAICCDPANNLIIADRLNHRIRKVDGLGTIHTVAGNGSQGFSGDNDTATLAELYRPQGVAFDSCGNLYIDDMNNRRIRKVTFNDSCGQTSTSGVALKAINGMELYPNPVAEYINIRSSESLGRLSVCNAMGHQVMQHEGGGKEIRLRVSELGAGVYYIEAYNADGSILRGRFIKE